MCLLLKDMADWAFYSYGAYVILFSGRPWFKLTSHPTSTLLRMLGLILGPDFLIKALAFQINHAFFNQNRHIFQNNFTPD